MIFSGSLLVTSDFRQWLVYCFVFFLFFPRGGGGGGGVVVDLGCGGWLLF